MTIEDYLRHHTFAPGAGRKLFAACWVMSNPLFYREYSIKTAAIKLIWEFFDSRDVSQGRLIMGLKGLITDKSTTYLVNTINRIRLNDDFMVELEVSGDKIKFFCKCEDPLLVTGANEDDATIVFQLADQYGFFLDQNADDSHGSLDWSPKVC